MLTAPSVQSPCSGSLPCDRTHFDAGRMTLSEPWSVGRAGVETVRYGGDTSSALVIDGAGECLLLDAGSGISHVEDHLSDGVRRLDILLSHLHMDHIQGLGFFRPLFDPDVEVHLWGLPRHGAGRAGPLPVPTPVPGQAARASGGSSTMSSWQVRGRPRSSWWPILSRTRDRRWGSDREDTVSIAYLSDHEPAGGRFPRPSRNGPRATTWRGCRPAGPRCQYTAAEYPSRAGWGHSSFEQCLAFARHVEARSLVTFHHDPGTPTSSSTGSTRRHPKEGSPFTIIPEHREIDRRGGVSGYLGSGRPGRSPTR